MNMAKRRWRVPKAKPGELKACFGRSDRFESSPDLCYVWGGKGVASSEGRVLSTAFEECHVYDGKNLRQVLEARGFDITTLRFSIQLKQPI